MSARMPRRVIHFANLPMKLMLPPPPLSSVREFAVKTIPSASKIDIRRCLESIYGFDIAEVHTLNYDGKKIKRGGLLLAKPDYKKAYITLRAPLSVGEDLFPIGILKQAMEEKKKKSEKEAAVMEEKKRQHWLDENKDEYSLAGGGTKDYNRKMDPKRKSFLRRPVEEKSKEVIGKFAWSGMQVRTPKPKRSLTRRVASAIKRERMSDPSWKPRRSAKEEEGKDADVEEEVEVEAEDVSGHPNGRQRMQDTARKRLQYSKGKSGGRNSDGHITSYHRGGGAKRLHRKVDTKRSIIASGVVESIDYDPNRSARIALVRWTDGEKPNRERRNKTADGEEPSRERRNKTRR